MSKRDEREMRRADAREVAEQQASEGFNTAVKIPEGAKRFQLKVGSQRIDIIEYQAGVGNPYAKQGVWHYERTYYVHGNVGPDQNPYCCLFKNWDIPCPICKFAAELRQRPGYDEKLEKSLRPKTRQLFNVIDTENVELGVQIFEVAPFNFGEALAEKIAMSDRRDNYKVFAHYDEGFTLRIATKEQSMEGGRKFKKVSDIEFRQRDKQYGKEVLERVHCLDDLLVKLSYEKLEAVFLQKGGALKGESAERQEDDRKERVPPRREEPEDDDPPPKPRKPVVVDDDDDPPPKPKRQPEPEPEPEKPKINPKKTAAYYGIEVGSFVEHDEHGKCEVVHISSDGTSLRLEDKEGDIHKAISPVEVELIKKKAPPKPAVDEDDDPPPKPKRPKAEDEDEPKPKKKPNPKDWEDDDDVPVSEE